MRRNARSARRSAPSRRLDQRERLRLAWLAISDTRTGETASARRGLDARALSAVPGGTAGCGWRRHDMMHLRPPASRVPRSVRVLVAAACLAAPASLPSQAAPPRVRLSGVVFDSTASAPLEGAVVQLVSEADPTRAWTARTDDTGAFAFADPAPGRYLLGFVHPRLEAVLLEPPAQAITVSTRDASVRLAIPSLPTIARAACADTPVDSGTTPVLGRVRAVDGSPLPAPARVTIAWSEVVIDRGVSTVRPELRALTDTSGIFRLCNVPAGTNVQLVAETDRAASGRLELTTPAEGALLQPLTVGIAERVRVDDADEESLLRGPGTLTGTIVTPDGAPLPRSRVRLFETAASAMSDSTGAFRLTGLPTGTHTLEAFAIGFAPVRRIVDVADAAGTSLREEPLRVTLERASTPLDTVRVFASADPFSWRVGFDARRARGLGRFVDEAAIARRNPLRTTDVLITVPGLTMQRGRFAAEDQIYLRDNSGELCLPDLFVDGMRLFLDGANIDSYVFANSLLGVEVYRSQALRPLEFTTENRCGAIVLWTGRRRTTPR